MNAQRVLFANLLILAGVAESYAAKDIQCVGVGLAYPGTVYEAADIAEGFPYSVFVDLQWYGLDRTKSWHVGVLLDGEPLGEFVWDNLMDDGLVHPGSTERAYAEIPCTIERGYHTLAVLVDSRHEVRERIERNNTLTRTLEVLAYPKELRFDDLRDFNGDGMTDLNVYDPLLSQWYSAAPGQPAVIDQFGYEPTIQFSGDFDGDGRSDRGILDRAMGTCYVEKSTGGYMTTQFGGDKIVPVPADYDGDGLCDLAGYDVRWGVWFINYASKPTDLINMNIAGCIPVPRDYDGDGRADFAVYDPASGLWHFHENIPGVPAGGIQAREAVPVPADYNGDGYCDVAIFTPSNYQWTIDYTFSDAVEQFEFGYGGVIPTPGDYNGDGRWDVAVYDPNGGEWFIQTSRGSPVERVQFGWAGALPIGIRR